MAFVYEPWVQETTNTTGTSDFTLNGAVSNYRAFSSVMSNGDTTVYVAVNGSQRERGIGELDGTTLKRTQVLRNSSGTTSKISFSSAGTRVFIDHPYSVSFELVREEIVSTPVAAIAFTGLDPYKDVRVRCSVRPSANAKSMYVRFSLDNGANWLSGAASYANAYIQGNSGPGGSGSAIVGHYNAAQLHTHNHDHLTDSEHLFDFFNFNKSRETFGYTESSGVHNDGTQYAMTRWLHRRFGAEAHNAVLFFWADAANFQVGSYIQLYGRRG